MYRDEAQLLVNHCYELGDIVDKWGCVVEPLGCGYFDECELTDHVKTDRTAFFDLRSKIGPPELALCTLDKFGICARQLLFGIHERAADAEQVYLLNDQYIVKPPYADAKFAYHQDTLYFSTSERQHLIVSAWTPLDAVSEANGTVLVDPFPDPSNPGQYPKLKGKDSFWADMPAGSVLFMDGRLRHCSEGNQSALFRTVYMPQFSLGAIDHGSKCIAMAVPVDTSNS
ncbi:hypothetical protein GGI12_005614 [Dipsacomyces acuminosporus]|nr:hypothetical protein GGI12_005614 [Dipsacomyces acuminosporus]